MKQSAIEALSKEAGATWNGMSKAYQGRAIQIIKAMLSLPETQAMMNEKGVLQERVLEGEESRVPKSICLSVGLYAHATGYSLAGFTTRPDPRDIFIHQEPDGSWGNDEIEPYDLHPPHVLLQMAERIAEIVLSRE